MFDDASARQFRHEELIDAEEQQDQGDGADPAEHVVVQRPATVLALGAEGRLVVLHGGHRVRVEGQRSQEAWIR
ncbi:hypothetical protein P3W53_29375 [Pseudomonas denitrificans (nom. rej.)]|nr:hypothetical protein [Pseudomonas denitrificans (nom. rej.)]